MMKIFFYSFLLLPVISFAQPNCDIYKRNANEPCYNACELAIEAADAQGTYLSQQKFNRVIELCPSFDYGYREKSVPYIKRGDYSEWKKLMDRAVDINLNLNLAYRGWCRYQFLRDYEGARQDLEKLDSLYKNNMGFSQNGDYHLKIVLALCYKGLGYKQKAIQVIEEQLNQKGYSLGIYDYLHLGVLYFEVGNLDAAIVALNKQINYNDYLAETYFYLALTCKKMGKKEKYLENLNRAKDFYIHNKRRTDPYTHPMDKIYLKTIEDELLKSNL